MKQQIIRSLSSLVLLASLSAVPVTSALAQDNSLRAPEVLDLDDPFARGINRAADQASGGLNLPSPGNIGAADAKTGAALLGASKQEALAVSLYRVAALAVAKGRSRGQIFEESNQGVSEGSRPELPYLRLGTFGSAAEARQVAINLKSLLEDYIGGHFILRSSAVSVDLDIGPTPSVSHAENYCELMLKYSNGLVQDCYAVLEYPGYEPLETFTSTAMLRVSADAVRSVISDDSVFDLQGSANQLLHVKEGDRLGTTGHQIVKVVPSGVVLMSDDGSIATLPLDYLPEADYQPQGAAGQPDGALTPPQPPQPQG